MNTQALENLLHQSQYDEQKTQYLIQGFTNGFDLGYRGDRTVRRSAPNLKFTIGNETQLWNKVMQEVQAKRYAGPYTSIPFESYIQSPIGLVPKDKGKKTRLIFHLSYPRKTNFSVNANTPEELSKVTYPSFEDAVKLCIKQGKNCAAAKSDLVSAFRHICIRREDWKFLVMKARSPLDGKIYYFIDKCLPFGASISCAIFQAFSDALAHITKWVNNMEDINYLDDFFFAGAFKDICDQYVRNFLDICQTINFPVSMEKTVWATQMTFLGLLIDTLNMRVGIPVDKVTDTLRLVRLMKSRKKSTLLQMQQLCGSLNFISKAVVPGRVFLRRLYLSTSGLTKANHHLNITRDIKDDLEMWEEFLTHSSAFSRPFFQFDSEVSSYELDLYTDAASTLGCGGYFQDQYFIAEWDQEFLALKPSINYYMELYAVTIAVLLWSDCFKNQNITLFCDNMSVVHMINGSTSRCGNCMTLLRIITLKSLITNVKITAKHVLGG